MYAEERQYEIATLAQSQGRVSVADLASRYDVTPETIRRDLDSLAHRGVLRRVHGGAVPVDKLRLPESPVGARDTSFADEKLAIAKRAISLLPQRDGLTVLLDAGTTTSRLCPLLPDWVSLVVTNSVPSALALSGRPSTEVLLLGGSVRGITQAAVGPHTLRVLEGLRVDIAFVGTNGFSVAHGFSTPDLAEAAIKEQMVRCASEVYVLADSSKLDADYLVRFAGLDDVDALVTDSGLPAEAAAELRAAGLRVDIA